MKVVILAGGLGTRISEESHLKPKPMIEIGGQPILWHIMKIYGAHGINEFVICCGYKGYLIKEFFSNYFLHTSDVTIDLQNNDVVVHNRRSEPWRVTLIDTGLNTQTGGRMKRVSDHISGTFCLTYGDGVSNVDITQSIKFHKEQRRLATVTAIRPAARFGALEISNSQVTGFNEKPVGDGFWINGGFFVCEPQVLDFIDGDETTWEGAPMENLAKQKQLSAFQHDGFWAPMDTLRDRTYLEELWRVGDAPWKIWK